MEDRERELTMARIQGVGVADAIRDVAGHYGHGYSSGKITSVVYALALDNTPEYIQYMRSYNVTYARLTE
jgi:hypothetical protein